MSNKTLNMIIMNLRLLVFSLKLRHFIVEMVFSMKTKKKKKRSKMKTSEGMVKKKELKSRKQEGLLISI